jgi:hypothetical protein
LTSAGLQDNDSSNKRDVETTTLYVRSEFTVLMAPGVDLLSATVRVINASGTPIRTFEVSAKSPWGGMRGGARERTRLNILQEQFVNLIRAELNDKDCVRIFGNREWTCDER